MLEELLALFRGHSSGDQIGEDLDAMIQESAELVQLAGDVYYQRAPGAASFSDLKKRDKGVNKLQQKIRKQAFSLALTDSGRFSLSFCLSIMNVVKDVERLGDYAKDLAELAATAGPAEQADEAPLVERVERLVQLLSPTMRDADQLKVVHLIELGKDIRRDLNEAQRSLLAEQQASLTAAPRVLALQYYIRIVSHSLNALSTLVTPLHKMDYTGQKHLLPEVKARLQSQAEPSNGADAS